MKTALALAASAHAAPAAAFLPAPRRALLPRLAAATVPGRVALTFDDGPAPTSTPQFLRVLAEHDVRATFFLLGSQAQRSPRLVREIAAAGHELGVHGWDHHCLLRRTPRATERELRATRDFLHRLTGTSPRWFRPPYGVFSTASLLSARRLGLTPVLWSTWGSTGPKAAPRPPSAGGWRPASATVARSCCTTVTSPPGTAPGAPPWVPCPASSPTAAAAVSNSARSPPDKPDFALRSRRVDPVLGTVRRVAL